MKILVTGGTGRIGSNLVKKIVGKRTRYSKFRLSGGMSIGSDGGTVQNA